MKHNNIAKGVLGRPLYAPFGDWLMHHSPRTFGALRIVRRGLAGLWRRKAWTVPALLLATAPFVLAAFAAAGELPALAGYALPLAVLGAFLVLSFALFYLSLRVYTGLNALSGEAVALRSALSKAKAEAQKGRSEAASLRQGLGDARAKLAGLDRRIDAGLGDAERRIGERIDRALETAQAEAERLARQISSEAGEELRKALGETRRAVEESRAEAKRLAEEASSGARRFAEEKAAVAEAALKSVNTTVSEVAQKAGAQEKATQAAAQRLDDMQRTSVGLDLAAVALNLRPLWLGGTQNDRRVREIEREHGHAVLMAALVDEEAKARGTLAGKTLIEIGMTREPVLGQRSTQKLAFFAALTDMRFIGVDMDGKNVHEAKRFMPYLNPGAQFVAQKGEDFLRLHPGPIDYVYLDAFDFDHGKHSEARQERYRQNLGTEINDEACWKMHADCAKTLVKRLSPGGIVALDDTWTDGEGRYHGKGKLAMPILLEAGFKVVAQTPMTICLRRAPKA